MINICFKNFCSIHSKPCKYIHQFNRLFTSSLHFTLYFVVIQFSFVFGQHFVSNFDAFKIYSIYWFALAIFTYYFQIRILPLISFLIQLVQMVQHNFHPHYKVFYYDLLPIVFMFSKNLPCFCNTNSSSQRFENPF